MAVATSSTRRQVAALPAEVTSFVGRRREVAEVRRLLSASRMVTLTGAGGVGKTRLALWVAAMVRRTFPDGVFLVELAGVEKPDLIVPTMIRTLEILDHSSRSPWDVLLDHLHDKNTLIVLDNCEHLLDECVVVADRLSRAAPELRILATSRQVLGIAGERTFAVPTLPLSDSERGHAAGAAMPSEAVQLFTDRAQAVVPAFAVTKANREAVERIVRRLDGIPLAIELAAVRLRALSVDQLLDRLDDRFRLLTSGSRAVLPRQQTLRALIDWSYALCTDKERLLWQRTSVFSGGLDLEAAEAVCSGDGITHDDVVEAVIGLVDKSILLREEHPAGVRYRLLETIRQYGREKLVASGREEALRRRHCDWYGELAHRLDEKWFGSDQMAWFGRLRRDHDNLRTAIDVCLSTPGEIQSGLAIAADLRFYWVWGSHLHEGRRWLGALLAAAPEPTANRAEALTVNALLAVVQGDFTVGEPMLDESRALAGRLDERAVLAQVAFASGLSALCRQDMEQAAMFLGEALTRHREIGHETGAVNSLIHLALADSFLGRSGEAVNRFEEALVMCESRDDRCFASLALSFFGIAAWLRGDTGRAIKLERSCIRLREPFNNRLDIGVSVEVLAWVAAYEGHAERAARLMGFLHENWRSVGCPPLGYLARFHDECEASARERLGTERYDAAFHEGAALTLEQAIAYVLRERIPTTETVGREQSPLTRRETEVAHLVARGLSNKEIAAELMIAQRTAEGHVEHILTKLGFTSRARIAAWITERDRVADKEHPRE